MATSNLEPAGSCTLSIHRAFVIRLYADVDLVNRRLRGQIEHVVSGQGSEFQSVEDLLMFIERVLHVRPSERL